METRIYTVVLPNGARRLVRAPNQARALRYITDDYRCHVTTQNELAELIQNGTSIEGESAPVSDTQDLPFTNA